MELAGLALETVPPEEAEWVARAAELRPVLEKYRDESEQDHRLAGPINDALNEGNFYRLCMPRSLDGEQLDGVTAARALEELARWNGSAGWNATLTVGVGPLSEYLPRGAAEEIWGHRDGRRNIVAGSVFPAGRAVRTAGGYTVSGRFPFCTNGQNADWLCAACVVFDGENLVVGPGGVPETRMLFLPRTQVEFLDTWHTLGLRGTGSHDFIVDDVFIAGERSFALAELAVGPPGPDAAYPYPLYTFTSFVAPATSLGIARAAIDGFRELAISKTPTAGLTPLAAQHTIQERVARAEAMVGAARSYLYDTLRRVAAAGPGAHPQVTALVRLTCAYVVETCTDAVKMMYLAGGGTALYESCPLERLFRDIHMITQHVAVAPYNIEMVGGYLLGQGLALRR